MREDLPGYSLALVDLSDVSLPLPPRNVLQQQYLTLAGVMERVAREMRNTLESGLRAQSMQPTIRYRIKTFDSYYEKLLRRATPERRAIGSVPITDIIGLRIVAPFVEDVRRAERVVREHFEILEAEQKGAEFSFREFGYESLHLLCEVPGAIAESLRARDLPPVEVQVRTILQDAWAEVEHELVYKGEFVPFDEPIRRRLAALNANLSLADSIFQEIRDYQRELQRELSRRRTEFTGFLRDRLGMAREELAEEHSRRARVQGMPRSQLRRYGVDQLLLDSLLAHNSGAYERAVGLYTMGLEQARDPRVEAILRLHRAMARFAVEQLEEARSDLERVIELDPGNARAWFYLAGCQWMASETEAAMDSLGSVLRLDPRNADAFYARARIHADNGSRESALADLRAALQHQPKFPEARALADQLSGAQTGERAALRE